MAPMSMLGVSIGVDDLEAAGEVLAGLGMTSVSAAGQNIWMGGRHFLMLTGPNGRTAGQPERVIYLSGNGDDFNIAGIEFKRWGRSAPIPADLEPASITGIDHVITMVASVEQVGQEFQKHGISKAEAVREFPAISTLARMFLVGDGYVELNEPLGSGTPAWGAASGIVGLVLQTDNIEQFRTRLPLGNLSRVSQVQARKPGQELETLGSVSLVKTRAFGDFQLFVYEAWLR